MRNRFGSTFNLDTTVVGLQGHPISVVGPTAGQALVFDGNDWAPTDVQMGPPAVPVGTTLPSAPGVGELYWDLDTAKLFLWDGTQWVVTINTPEGSSSGVSGVTSFNNRTGAVTLTTADITPVGVSSFNGRMGAVTMTTSDITGASGATQAQLANYLPLAGGTLSGALTVDGTNGLSVPNGSIVAGQTVQGANVNATGAVSAGANVVAGGVLQVGGTSGPYWQNNGGTMYCPGGQVSGASLISAPNVAGTNVWVGGYGNLYMTDSQGFIAAANGNFMCSAIAIGNNPSVTWSFASGYMATAPSVMANAFVESSDQRNKRNINPNLHGLAEVLQLQPVTFIRADDRRLEAGFIAQDVQSILPEAVVTLEPDPEPSTPSTVTDIAIRQAIEDGGGPLLAIQYSCITAALVNAVKELSAKIDALEGAP